MVQNNVLQDTDVSFDIYAKKLASSLIWKKNFREFLTNV